MTDSIYGNPYAGYAYAIDSVSQSYCKSPYSYATVSADTANCLSQASSAYTQMGNIAFGSCSSNPNATADCSKEAYSAAHGSFVYTYNSCCSTNNCDK